MMTIATTGCFFLVGGALGLVHFAWLRHDVRRYFTRNARRSAVFSHAARLAVIVLSWVALARFGGPTGILGAFVGFVIARPIVAARTSGSS